VTHSFAPDDIVTWDGSFDGRVCAVYPMSQFGNGFLHIEITRTTRDSLPVGRHTTIALSYAKHVTDRVAFAPGEVERCKAHGSAAYEAMAADAEQVRILARAAWIRTLPPYLHGESIGDYAAKAGILPPKPGKRDEWEDSVVQAVCERLMLENA
jgi:hypothetical protein